MKLKRFSHSSGRESESGFNLVELLVASALGLVVTSIGLSTFLSSKELVHYDMQRTTLTQNLRAGLDIIGMNIRLAGENLPSSFPAIEIIDGGTGPDQLIIRRNLKDEVLKVCAPLVSTTSDNMYFATAGTTPGCIYADQAQNLAVWQQYLADESGEALAYIHEPSSNSGEFFWFDNIVDTGTEIYLDLMPGEEWQTDYPIGNTAVYVIEDWQFSLQGDELVMVPEQQNANLAKVMFGISDMQIQVEFNDGTTQNTLNSTDDWTEVKFIDVSLSGATTASGKTIERTIRSRFFPRNVLSN
jgi:prepilin-type N-terminal cleavage/methylation domain-containing protein